mmetsp:Transcript_9144/g.13521  ORF Transcript_9144/g.13521 Transcript_9144/m.13521 type:complete len:697 (+) Transcript_9144:25-2115(+)
MFSMRTSKKELFLTILILGLTYVLAFATRLFSVLRFESVIHEFDPYFNFRSTKYLIKNGLYAFNNWFDDFSWYPIGRIVGGTVYPGIQFTAALIWYLTRLVNLTIDIRNICVLCAPFFASNTAISMFFLGKEIGGSSVGLLASIMIAIVPGYISRSVAGSFDCEGVAIFALITVFYLWLVAVRTGSVFRSVLTALAYFYMVNAWGGYVFIINLIPVYVLVLLFTGRYTNRLYVAYSVFYVLGTFLSMQVRFVSFLAVQGGEHMGAFGVFGLIQIACFVNWLRSMIDSKTFNRLVQLIISGLVIGAIAIFILGSASGLISPWSGRFYAMLDPTYAKKHIPIIASVSEHQPTTWASFFFDLHILTLLTPVGLYFCYQNLNEATIFIALYGTLSVYFAGVMVRLMLVLAPAACLLSALGVSKLLDTYINTITANQVEETSSSKKKSESTQKIPTEVAASMLLGIALMLIFFVYHCTWVTSEAYSSPSIVLAARGNGGQRIIFDDFREAYNWLSQNTAPDAKVMSWWDYGYQLTAMANRTIIVDNNTWNNSHIATVGTAMSSSEEDAYPIIRRLDVNYVLVIFGGYTGYQSDDINKFLWMVRIGGSVFKHIKERDYLNERGEYRIDSQGTKTMLNSLMYKLCYYRFGEMMTEMNRAPGFDRVRQVEIGRKNFDLTHLEEAYSSEHYIVRIYKVKDLPNNH